MQNIISPLSRKDSSLRQRIFLSLVTIYFLANIGAEYIFNVLPLNSSEEKQLNDQESITEVVTIVPDKEVFDTGYPEEKSLDTHEEIVELLSSEELLEQTAFQVGQEYDFALETMDGKRELGRMTCTKTREIPLQTDGQNNAVRALPEDCSPQKIVVTFANDDGSFAIVEIDMLIRADGTVIYYQISTAIQLGGTPSGGPISLSSDAEYEPQASHVITTTTSAPTQEGSNIARKPTSSTSASTSWTNDLFLPNTRVSITAVPLLEKGGKDNNQRVMTLVPLEQ